MSPLPISPIILQRRHSELGRIRLGDQQATSNGRTRPNKLERFRFTSVSRQYIEDLATLYGGNPKPWDNAGVPSWEVYTTTAAIPVIAVKGGLSQWMEYWAGGGLVHRCDGERQADGTLCDPDETFTDSRGEVTHPHLEAKPTTRLSVMLPELDAVGVFRMESHGWNAAAEIPAVAELAQFVGDLVPAVLHLQERRTVKDGKTSRFVVPVLDLRIGAARLREVVAAKSGSGDAAAVEAPAQRRAIEAPATSTTRPATATDAAPEPVNEWITKADGARTVEELQAVWAAAVNANLIGATAADTPEGRAFIAHATALSKKLPKTPAASQPSEQPAKEDPAAALAEAAEADAVWARCLAAGADIGLDTLPKMNTHFAETMGFPSMEATAAELEAYLVKLQSDGTAVA